jgi:hypothetical protein
VSKSKGNGSSRQSLVSGEPISSSASDNCPREQMIAEAAYYRAQQRGFEPGSEMSDWLQAEAVSSHAGKYPLVCLRVDVVPVKLPFHRRSAVV